MAENSNSRLNRLRLRKDKLLSKIEELENLINYLETGGDYSGLLN
ncbi:hypothetical protein SAMN05216352_1201, partial [Alteribacillus bidgolensis]